MSTSPCKRRARSFSVHLWLLLCLGAVAAGPTRGAAQGSQPPPAPTGKSYGYRPFDLALAYPINFFHDKHKVITGLSINLLYGRTTSVYGIELGGLINHDLEDMIGFQFAGIGNLTKRDAVGLQVSGIFNAAHGACVGACISGIANRHEAVHGLQLALANFVAQDSRGVQIAVANAVGNHAAGLQVGVLNFVRRNFDGLQIAVYNWNNYIPPATVPYNDYYVIVYPSQHWSGHSRAVQISAGNIVDSLAGMQIGACNGASSVIGAQIAGIFNLTKKSVVGAQVSPINWAREMTGLQLGVINIAARLAGAQIGVFNIAYKNWLPFMLGINAGRRWQSALGAR